jgi:multidrug efflux pump subunit AcrA (membrane-fusion protein)
MSAKVAFLERMAKPDEQKPRTALHQSSLVDRKEKKVVFVVKEDQVVETPVNLGSPMGDMVEVLGGVKVGDRVVLNPPDRLKNGSKIKIEER